MAILKIKVSQKWITDKCTIILNFNAVKIKWQLVFLWVSWSKLSNSDSSRQQCLWWSYTSLSSWTQGAAVKGLNYLCLFVGSWRCPDTEREITFKGLRTYYRAVSGAAGGHWPLGGSVTFKDKKRVTSDGNAGPPPATPRTDCVGAVTCRHLPSPAVTIRPERIRLKSRKSCFPLLKNPDMKCWLSAASTGGRRSFSSCLPHRQRTIRC